MSASTPLKIVQAIEQGLEALISPGQVFEIRIPHTRKGTVSGYFDDISVAANAAAEWDGQAPGLYCTINSINPVLRARSYNHLRVYAKTATTDGDIVRRIRLYIDVDPVRPTGISANNEEHEAALTRAWQIIEYLSSLGWPPPLFVDSGNGAQLIYAIDLPNDQESLELVSGVLEALSSKFDDDEVEVDTTVANASRIAKIAGSLACKGNSMADRPHRRSRIISKPPTLQVVSREQLQKLVAQYAPKGLSKEQSEGQNSNGSGDSRPEVVPPQTSSSAKIPNGKRQPYLRTHAGKLLNNGIGAEALELELLRINREKFAEPKPEAEIRRQAQDLHRRYQVSPSLVLMGRSFSPLLNCESCEQFTCLTFMHAHNNTCGRAIFPLTS